MPTYKGYIDRKVTIWQRFHYDVTAANKPEFKKLLKAEAEIPFYPADGPVELMDSQFLLETNEDLTVEDNQGQPVAEAFDEKGNQIV